MRRIPSHRYPPSSTPGPRWWTRTTSISFFMQDRKRLNSNGHSQNMGDLPGRQVSLAFALIRFLHIETIGRIDHDVLLLALYLERVKAGTRAGLVRIERQHGLMGQVVLDHGKDRSGILLLRELEDAAASGCRDVCQHALAVPLP